MTAVSSPVPRVALWSSIVSGGFGAGIHRIPPVWPIGMPIRRLLKLVVVIPSGSLCTQKIETCRASTYSTKLQTKYKIDNLSPLSQLSCSCRLTTTNFNLHLLALCPSWLCRPTCFLSTTNSATVVLLRYSTWECNSHLFTTRLLWISPDATAD